MAKINKPIHHLEVVYTTTADDLRLQGMHYAPLTQTDTCVVFIHGQSGFFIESMYADVVGRVLAKNNIAFLYTHNRGYAHTNDIIRGKPKPDGGYEYSRQGSWYERFSKCKVDINAWISYAADLGYSRLIIAGHSLGGTKVIYWYFKTRPKNIEAVILASPADNVGLTVREFTPSQFDKLITEAYALVAKGHYNDLLSATFDEGWDHLSAQAFLEGRVPGSPADVLPLTNNPKQYPALASINVPLLVFFGDHDEINVHTVPEDLAIIKTKATNSPQVTTTIIKGANHMYHNQEENVAKVILNWLTQLTASY